MDLKEEFNAIRAELQGLKDIKTMLVENSVPEWIHTVQFNTAQTASIVGMSYQKLNRLINQGKIEHSQDGTRFYFTYEQILKIKPQINIPL